MRNRISISLSLLAALVVVGLTAWSSVGLSATPVDLKLLLLVDVSGSVDATEFALQRGGYVQAFQDPAIQANIASLPGGIAVAYAQWSGFNQQSLVVNWTHLTDAASANAFAAAVAAAPRAFSGNTAPGSALGWASGILYETNLFIASRYIIDVSGDGAQNDGIDTFTQATALHSAGATINGLAILGEVGLATWYSNNIVVPGGGKLYIASGFSDFAEAVTQKVGEEIQGALSITKECTAFVESNIVYYTGNVINTGNGSLVGVTIVDDNATPADTSDDVVVLGPVTLNPGQTNFYSGYYVPSTCGVFTNTVTATGFDLVHSNTVSAVASAICEIPCPQLITCEVQFFTQTTNGFEQVVDNGCGTSAPFGMPVGTTILVGVQICADAGNSGSVSNLNYALTFNGTPFGSIFNGVVLAPGACEAAGSFIAFHCDTANVNTFAVTATADAGGGTTASTSCSNTIECCSTCPTCELGTNGVPVQVVVDQNVTFNFNTGTPSFSGDPSLAPYISYDTSGPTPDTWRAIFNVGGKALLITSNATITTTTVPATSNNRRAPGIEIDSTCSLTVDQGSKILVQSENRNAGDILIQVDGNVTINGTVSNVVNGTRGRPGKITIGTSCGNIVTGPQGRIVTYGQDFGGSDINLASCESGSILIYGLVDASYKAAVASKINIAAFGGSVFINGTNSFGSEVVNGNLRRITSGVSVRSRRDPLPGAILIQASEYIDVLGNRLIDRLHPNYGAVAIKTASNGSKGGLIDLRAGLSIGLLDRALDNANRFNAGALNSVQAGGGIGMQVTASINDGASDYTKAVVSAQGGSAGKGGTNLLRAFNGDVSIGLGAQVLANFTGTPGANGANLLTSCLGVSNVGTVSPADADNTDDSGVCGGGPDQLFQDCSDLGL